jgi:hypothetical protein
MRCPSYLREIGPPEARRLSYVPPSDAPAMSVRHYDECEARLLRGESLVSIAASFGLARVTLYRRLRARGYRARSATPLLGFSDFEMAILRLWIRGVPRAAMAERLGRPVSHVRAQFFTARRKLRALGESQ